ncbi:class I SAM-dependent methyltransferase [Neolewinella agarilytica]|uniref:Ubiquinone/menaquinone biosynthesis C-methylase UbiE n=1 Tax=Neolewinella agarilytica TaxID=478744 RepID=A0A1H9E338_9BACT|nr:class I SAM-dependent methyltransferase [Neolewinella agarilytica]SEQ19368.1 Ubiquinone/menaquinone biosynthesis C-methylase UbiE [Neolewinella agarilytica]
MNKVAVTKNVQEAYNSQYDDRMTQWRELGARYKSRNIIAVTKGKKFAKVLDFGAGEGSILKQLDDHAAFEKLYAVEISDSGIAQIAERDIKSLVEVKKFDGYTTEYADNEFDLVYCSHVIEHVEHPRLVLREIKRISKAQVFEVPLDYGKGLPQKTEHFLAYGHINIFTPAIFKFLLMSEGFRISEELHANTPQEILEFNWYENMKLKKSLKRRILAQLLSNKARLARLVFGREKANEFYSSSYTCFTEKSGELTIF